MNKNFVEEVLRRNGLTRALEDQEAVFRWPEAAGSLAQFAEADYVQDGTLYLTASSPSAAQEITLLATTLMERLNRRLTHGPIHHLRVKAAGLPRKRRKTPAREAAIDSLELDALSKEIPDSDLREAFVKLYTSQRNREAALLAVGAKRCSRCGVIHDSRGETCPGCRYDAIEESSDAN